MGLREKAEVAYQKAIALKPKNENAYINLGVHYAKTGKVLEGIMLLKEAVRVHPQSATAYHNLALLLIKEKKWAEAVQTLNNAYERTGVEKFKTSLTKLLKRAHAIVKDLVHKKEYPAAEDLLRLLPDDPVTLTNLGMVLHLQKEYDKEKEVLKKLIVLDGPLARNAFANLAKLYEQSGDHESALQTLREALKKKPESYFEQELARLAGHRTAA